MKPVSYLLFAITMFTVLLFSSCKEENKEDLTQAVNKDGSVETSVTVEHADNLNDVLLTKHIVWNKGSVAGTYEHRDTVPALGSNNSVVKDEFGNDKNVEAKKEYEIFITVK